MNRRTFLKAAAAGALAVPALRAAQEDKPSYSDYLPDEGKDVLAETEDNIEGPYYLPDAPFRDKVHQDGDKGDLLVVTGVVKARNGKCLANAEVEIWQADADGRYYNEEGDDPKTYRFRIRLKTNEKGEYRYESIRPGRYKISARQSRPAHIHVKAHCKRYKSLTTQLYFHDDDLNKSDPWFKKSLAVEFKEDGKKKTGKFDIVLARA